MSLIKLKDYNTSDTISAIATFPSRSALGVIKISGKNALKIIHRIFLPRRKKDIRQAKTYTLHYGWIVEKVKGKRQKVKGKRQKVKGKRQKVKVIDEVLVSIMRSPCSYTCEDVAEVSCHAGAIALNKILQVMLKQGSRLAEPGEFTYRAFLNGRIDLLQAEGIRNIVEAKTDKALQTAVLQLKGESFEKFNKVKKEIKDVFLSIEAEINFPEDDTKIEYNGIKLKIRNISSRIKDILQTDKESKIIKDGLRCAICGKTNVGKSTLFNCLLQEERVIVSEIPGTTRDAIEEIINVQGVPLRIYDTAGILNPRDLIERQAQEKTSKIFNEADLIMLVMDGSRPLEKDDRVLLNKIKNLDGKKNETSSFSKKGVIVIINKSDLKQRLNLKSIPYSNGFKVKLSALKKEGLKDLERAIVKTAAKFGSQREDAVFLNAYQSEILKNACSDIEEAQTHLAQGREIDLVNLSLKNALDNLGKLTGEVYCEELLESIFGQFCIGK